MPGKVRVTTSSRGKEGEIMEFAVDGVVDKVEIEFEKVSDELKDSKKRTPPETRKPMPPEELETMTSFALVALQKQYPNFVVMDLMDKANVTGPDIAGENLHKAGFTPIQVFETIYALDSMPNLKGEPRASVQYKRIILETVNSYFPLKGQIDVDEYFDSKL